MLPTTEKELELYFKLQELMQQKDNANRPYSMYASAREMEYHKNKFEELKTEYLKLVKQTLTSYLP